MTMTHRPPSIDDRDFDPGDSDQVVIGAASDDVVLCGGLELFVEVGVALSLSEVPEEGC